MHIRHFCGVPPWNLLREFSAKGEGENGGEGRLWVTFLEEYLVRIPPVLRVDSKQVWRVDYAKN